MRDGPEKFHVRLASSARAPRQARQAVAVLLARANRSDLTEDAELLVDELVANAVLHAEGPVSLTAGYANGTLRVEVGDSNPEPAMLRQPLATDESGRGLWLVARMATSWASETGAEGKTVWFELT